MTKGKTRADDHCFGFDAIGMAAPRKNIEREAAISVMPIGKAPGHSSNQVRRCRLGKAVFERTGPGPFVYPSMKPPKTKPAEIGPHKTTGLA